MSDKYTIHYFPTAKADLYDIHKYISFNLGVPETASKLIKKIMNKINSLEDMPTRYKKFEVNKWKNLNAYEFNVDNYKVIYTVYEDNHIVLIHNIIYSKRDFGSM